MANWTDVSPSSLPHSWLLLLLLLDIPRLRFRIRSGGTVSEVASKQLDKQH